MAVPGLDPRVFPAIHVFAEDGRRGSLRPDARRLGLHMTNEPDGTLYVSVTTTSRAVRSSIGGPDRRLQRRYGLKRLALTEFHETSATD